MQTTLHLPIVICKYNTYANRNIARGVKSTGPISVWERNTRHRTNVMPIRLSFQCCVDTGMPSVQFSPPLARMMSLSQSPPACAKCLSPNQAASPPLTAPQSAPPPALVRLLLRALSPVLHPVGQGQGRGRDRGQGWGPGPALVRVPL